MQASQKVEGFPLTSTMLSENDMTQSELWQWPSPKACPKSDISVRDILPTVAASTIKVIAYL